MSRAELAALLWPRSAEEQARGSLRQAVHELGLSLLPAGPGLLDAGRDSVALDAAGTWVDAVEITRATAAQSETLNLLTAPFLPEMDGISALLDAWLAEERNKLASKYQTLTQVLAAQPNTRFEGRTALLPPTGRNTDSYIAPNDSDTLRQVSLVTYDAHRDRVSEESVSTESSRTSIFKQPCENFSVQAPSRARRGIRLGVPPLAVLGMQDDHHLAIGLAEEITAALSRFRWLFLADPAALAAASDLSTTADAMGLEHFLLGSVQRVESRVRVALRLVNTPHSQEAPGAVLWAARFESQEHNQLAIQDEIATAVVGRLDPELLLIEAQRAFIRPSRDVSAHDLMLRALPALHALEPSSFEQARCFLDEATRRDPEYAAAYAWAAFWEVLRVGQGWASDHDEALLRAGQLAAKAARLDPFDALALTMQGHVLAYLHHRPEEGCVLHDRALRLNPNLAMAWVFSGLSHCYCGRHEEALDRFARYARLAPLHPLAFFFDSARLVPLMLLKRFDEVVQAAQAASILNPDFSFPLRPWLASLGWLGRTSEADTIRTRLLAIEPGLTINLALRRAPLRPHDRETYSEGLRRAGLREG